jgi:anti-anti-sigma factor
MLILRRCPRTREVQMYDDGGFSDRAGPRRASRGDSGKHSPVSTLGVRVTAGDAGPVLILAGEADVTNAEQLRDAVSAQLVSGAVYLTIDAAGLSFADSSAMGILAGAGRTLKELGGGLVLLRPQEGVLRTLTLLEMCHVITIHSATDGANEPKDDAGYSP